MDMEYLTPIHRFLLTCRYFSWSSLFVFFHFFCVLTFSHVRLFPSCTCALLGVPNNRDMYVPCNRDVHILVCVCLGWLSFLFVLFLTCTYTSCMEGGNCMDLYFPSAASRVVVSWVTLWHTCMPAYIRATVLPATQKYLRIRIADSSTVA